MKSLKLRLGLYDDPEEQRQEHYEYDMLKSNLAVFGSAMSGKTMLLKTLLLRLHQVSGLTEQEEVYILDFSNDLKKYETLPFVVGYFDSFSEENVRRVFRILEDKLTANIYSLEGSSYSDSKKAVPHITFLIDGLNAFLSQEQYAVYHEKLQRFLRDGISKGLTVVVAASDTANGVTRLLPYFDRVIALNLPKDKYAELFLRHVEKPMILKGRGLANLDMDIYEFQAYLPYNWNAAGNSEEDEIERTCIRMQMQGASVSIRDSSLSPELLWAEYRKLGDLYDRIIEENKETFSRLLQRKLKNFGPDLTEKNWYDSTGEKWEEYLLSRSSRSPASTVTLGLEYYNFDPVEMDLLSTRSIAIYGRKQSGKTNLLSLILKAAAEIPNSRFVLWDDGRGGLNHHWIQAIMDGLGDSDRVKEITSGKAFFEYLDKKGYFRSEYFQPGNPLAPADSDSDSWRELENPFTVFVIQSREYFRAGGTGLDIISLLERFVTEVSEKNRKLVIFSDVQPISEHLSNVVFNNCVSRAFLLDDILRFVQDRGRSSVFASRDIQDLKEQFGPCDKGDGFSYDRETDALIKMKFIKHPE